MKKLEIALIGAGQIVRTSHMDALQTMDYAKVVGVSDTNKASAESLAKDFDIPYATDSHKELLEKCKLDAVYVCVPNKFHHDIVIDALEAGCHVFCEKPPAISAAEAKEMAELAKAKGLLLSYDFHLRHGKNVQYIKENIENGSFGEVYFARAKWLRRAGVPGWGNFISKEMQGGGPLIDIGTHMIDLALYLLDYPKISYVTASMSDRIGKNTNNGFFGEWDPQKYTVEDGLFGMIHFENGGCLEVETSFALNMKEKDIRCVELYGDRLGASLFPTEVFSGLEGNFENKQVEFPEDGDLHINANQNFVKACLGMEKLLVTADQGAYVQSVIEALYASATSNKPIIF